jgi:hypothetical protein
VVGHNYVLGVTTRALSEADERIFEEKIEASLIHKLQSRDLGLHVEFLKGIEINDENLLRAFWKILGPQIRPNPLLSLSLKRDDRTVFVMSDRAEEADASV